ncbi:MAG: Lrp/AsnC family transcriptional regulator [Candidatus Azotimanducaceae bacterium]|jgi:Lrp/AsnC family transcriptional regulator
MKNLDSFDIKILRELQKNSDISMQDLGERVGLSHTPCWRRVKRLQEDGVIRRRVTLLDGKSLGLEVNVFVHVTLKNHQENGLTLFEESVHGVSEIVECYTVSGDRDFLLRIIVADVAAYEQLLKHTLINLPGVDNLSSTFALRQVKYTTEFPLVAMAN